MLIRRFYKQIEDKEIIQRFFFILNLLYIEEECLICYECIQDKQDKQNEQNEQEQNEENIMCHECNKVMHISCIEKWFEENNKRTCPHCRTKWKFEIDIIEKPAPVYIELDEYSLIPNYKNRNNTLTTMGTISGPINARVNNNNNNNIYQTYIQGVNN